MSASLVGSEMCIRDSRRIECAGANPPRPPPWAARHRCNLRGATRGQHAVSYTHLTLPTICSV
eukprot:2823263-Alexandrium_andersonii.AAC.1